MGFVYDTGMSCLNCQSCALKEITDENGKTISEKHICIIDGCEVDHQMMCGNYH